MKEIVTSLNFLLGAGAGFVVAAFLPAVGRKIKSFFVTETAALKVRVAALEAQIVKDGQAAIAAAEKKV